MSSVASSAMRSRRCANNNRPAAAERSPRFGGAAARTFCTWAVALSRAVRSASQESPMRAAASSSCLEQCSAKSASRRSASTPSRSPSPVVKQARTRARTKPSGSSAGRGRPAASQPRSRAITRSSREAPCGGNLDFRSRGATWPWRIAAQEAAIFSNGATSSRRKLAWPPKRGASQTSDQTATKERAAGGIGTPHTRVVDKELPIARPMSSCAQIPATSTRA
mmetsp:Transcript_13106/g.37696  ORF Transcript_13106/g.37696 Transcript_13106/m.37696 type:complete len:223 (-) Transcript_13106:7-675(-)